MKQTSNPGRRNMSFSFTNVSREKIARVASVIFVIATLFLSIRPAAAAVDPVNKNLFGTALKGYDAVAYFKEGRPVKGKDEFRHDWMGAKWYFASAANRDEFAKNPEKSCKSCLVFREKERV
jgi:YHS domain-containing protein